MNVLYICALWQGLYYLDKGAIIIVLLSTRKVVKRHDCRHCRATGRPQRGFLSLAVPANLEPWTLQS